MGKDLMAFAVRLLMALVGGVVFYELGARYLPGAGLGGAAYALLVAACVIGGIVLWAVGGHFLCKAVAKLGRSIDRAGSTVTASGLIFTTVGLLIGLAIAGLGSLAIKDLPVVGPYLLPVFFAASGYLFAYLGFKRHTDLARVLGFKGLLQQPGAKQFIRPKLLDTSAIIDGRVAAAVTKGFIEGDLVIPAFVLEELQSIADSGEPGKRARGRRGLEVLNRIQRNTRNEVKIHDGDFPEEKEVDAKLILLARNLNAKLFTNDYNLGKVAELQNIPCVNLHELAKSMRVILLPGEVLTLRIAREGKDRGQGVGYLPDGTMVVVNRAQN